VFKDGIHIHQYYIARSHNCASIQQINFIFFCLCVSLLLLTTLPVAHIIKSNDGIINKQQTEGLNEVEETGIDVICGTTVHLLDELRRTTNTLCQDSQEAMEPRYEVRNFRIGSRKDANWT
jgi:hypothetical protein